MSGLSVSIGFNRLPQMSATIRARAADAVRQTALELEEEAQRNAHVITGSMRASVYHVIAGGESNYAEHSSDAESLNKRAVILDQAAPALATEPGLGAVVGVAVMHGIFEEEGRAHRFLLPAAEQLRPVFQQRIAQVIRP